MTNLKTPFIISILFHGVVLLSVSSFYKPSMEIPMDITPLEFIRLPEEEKPLQPEKEKPKEKTLPIKIDIPTPPKVEEKKEEIKPVEEVIPTPPKVEEKKEEIRPVEEVKEELKVEGKKVEVKKEELNPAQETVRPAQEIKQNPSKPVDKEVVAIPTTIQTNTLDKSSTISGDKKSEVSSTPGEGVKGNTHQSDIIARAPSLPDKAQEYGVEGGTGTGKGSGDELTLFKAMVRTKIERSKFYPRWARERGCEGVVGVHFVILPDGKVGEVKVVRPGHCEVLNKAACEAIKKAAPFNPRPKELDGKEMAMEIDIGYRLE